MIATVGHTEPSPRRVRVVLGKATVADSARATYVWEWPYYPQYYLPFEDFDPAFLVDEGRTDNGTLGEARCFGLRVGNLERPGCLRVFTDNSRAGLSGLVKVDWDAPDAWFEEDERIFVHPRNPYTRVDALRSNQRLRIEFEGVALATATSVVKVFETGLPTRYYVDRTAVDFTHLEHSETQTPCPYKGRTSDYWSIRIGAQLHQDLVWSYDYPTPALAPIAGLVAFYNEKVDIFLDGKPLARPVTHFFDSETN